MNDGDRSGEGDRGHATAMDRFRAAGAKHLSSGQVDAVLALARPAVHLAPDEPVGRRSHLGGEPLLQPSVIWPHWDEKPLSLLAVLDLAELAGMEMDVDLPTEGILNFFFEADEQMAWGFDPAHRDGWKVVFTPAGVDAVERPAPPGSTTFDAVFVRPVPTTTLPSLFQEPEMVALFSDDGAKERLFAVAEELEELELDSPCHQIGGWPRLVQGALWGECQLASNGLYLGDGRAYGTERGRALASGADDWVLLLQVDSDEQSAVNWMWGDSGTLYFCIRRQDLAERRFDRCWGILQCY